MVAVRLSQDSGFWIRPKNGNTDDHKDGADNQRHDLKNSVIHTISNSEHDGYRNGRDLTLGKR